MISRCSKDIVSTKGYVIYTVCIEGIEEVIRKGEVSKLICVKYIGSNTKRCKIGVCKYVEEIQYAKLRI